MNTNRSKQLTFFKSLLAIATTLLLLLATIQVHAQDPSQYGTPFTGVPDIRDVNMYEVNTRAFSTTGNFAGVTARLDSIKALGINVIYLMPIYPVGVLNSVNSPYCIRNFDSVGSEFGALSDLRTLVAGAHTRNMAVILDFVVNQTSWDHPWITAHPSWYHHNADGSIAQLGSYTDVAALDLTNDSVRNQLDSSMRFWIFTANVDGFRCDFADNPPNAFWSYVLPNLRGITTHTLILMAEGTRDTNYTSGFDYNFGYQSYYNSLVPIYQSGSPVTLLDTSNVDEYIDATGNKQIIRFLTNHDENGTNDAGSDEGTAVYLFGGDTGSIAAFATIAFMKGVPFVYNGQEVDFATPIAFPYTSVKINWATDYESEQQYSKILNYRTASVAMRRGTLTSYDNSNIAAFTKISGSDTEFVVANLRGSSEVFTVPSSLQGSWYNGLTGATASVGSTLSLVGYQYTVYSKINPNTPPTGVSVSPTTANVSVNNTVQLSSTVTPSTASQSVTWSSSNTSILSVNASGLVTGVAAGTATITVTTATGGFTAKSVITASVTPATGVTVAPATGGVSTGGTLQLTYTVSPSNASNKNVTWSTSSASIASVSTTGLVTGVAVGTATITATTASGGFTAKSVITVSATPTFTVHFYRPSTWGTTINIYWWDALPTGVLANGSWPGVAMTNNGNNWYSYTFTGITSDSIIFNDGTNQTGNLYRGGTNGWYENNIWYNSAPTSVTGVSLSPTTASLSAGNTQQLTYTITPSGAVNQNVSWSSNNNAVASVSSTGLVTAVSAGTATVTVTTQDGSFTAHCVVTVTGTTGFTVHFYRPSTWGTSINIYWWDALPSGVLANGTWPGVSMTNNGNNWYSYTFTGITSDSVIFNDGSNQTANLYRSSNGWYENGIWYSSAPTAVTGVSVSPTTASIAAGGTQTVTATITPSGAVNQNVSWSSSNTSVASVSTSGVVTGIAAGTATVTVTTQDGSFTANCVVTVTGGSTTYYNIYNRWQSVYLYDGGTGKVLYGSTPGTNTAYQWAQLSAGSGYIYLQNRSTGNYMHVQDQDGWVECGSITESWWSAMWQLDAAGSGWDYIENRWQTGEWIHIEDLDGYAEYASPETGWYSAMWEFVNGTSGRMAEQQQPAATGSADARIYPNPAYGNKFYVMIKDLPDNETVKVTVHDLQGQTVLEADLTVSGEISHNLVPGMYIVSMQSPSINVTQKLVIE